MAINKNFVIKNGIQANDNLFVADSDNNKVGIKTAIPDYDFHVIGGIGATHALVTGVTTTSGLLDINGGGQANTFKVEDLTDNRIVIAGTGGELEDSGNLTFDGTTLGLTGSQTISGDIDVDGHTDLDDLIVAGVSTFSANIDANGNLDVDGQTDLDVLNVAETATFTSATDNTLGDENTGSVQLDGGMGIAKNLTVKQNLHVGGYSEFVGVVTFKGGTINLGDANTDNVVFTADVNSHIVPNTDDTYDLGSSSQEWRDLYLNGTANIDSLVADTADIDGGTIDGATIGGATPAAGTFTNLVANGNVDLGDATSDTITATGRFDSDLVPSTDDARDLGTSTLEWRNLYLNGTANIDSLVADTADINAGTIDGATIGANSASTGAFTTISASSNVTITGNLDVDGRTDLDDLVVAGVSTFSANIDADGDLDVDGHTDLDDLVVAGVSTFLDAAVFNSTGSIQIPAGTTGQRLSPAAIGQIRYNTQLSQFEGYGAGNAWGSLGGVKDVDGDTFIRAESAAGEDEDTLEFLTADATRVTINAAGRVGIGSTLPTTNLDVDGTGAISGDLTVVGVVTSTTFIGNLTGNVTGNTSGSAGSLAAGATGVDLTLSGDLTVNGTTTTINSTTVSVDDKNIELGSTSSPSDTSADGGGITLKGTSDHTFNWVNSTDAWTSSEHLDLASGKGYMLNGTTVLSGTTLGSTIVTSSLTALGTITTGVWNGTAIDNAYLANSTMSVGGVTLTLGATDATPAFDLSDATNYPTTSLTGTITNAQLAGSIADSKLSTISTADKVSISALNIDGGTDIGAALADADLFIVDDGGGGTNRYTAASRIKSYIADVTLTTAAQTNITSVGTLSALAVSGDITIADTIVHDGDSNTKIRFPAADSFSVETAGSERLLIDASGNVDIGANDGSSSNTGWYIQPDGTAYVFTDGSTDAVKIYAGSGDERITLKGDGELLISDKITHMGDTNTNIRFPAADTFAVETAGNERLRVTSDGKVGINSTSPTADLEVAGTTGTASTVFINAPAHNSSTASEAVLKFGYAHSGSPGAVAEIKLVEGSTNSFGGHLTFGVPDNNGSGGSSTSEALRITSGGKVGIGTDNPDELLEVGDETAVGGLKVSGQSTGITDEGITFDWASSTNAGRIFSESAGDSILQFYTTNSGTRGERLHITADGKIGIGVNPDVKLQVKLDTDKHLYFQGNIGEIGSVPGIQGVTDAGALAGLGLRGNDLRFATGNAERLRVSSGGNVLVGTSTSRIVEDHVGNGPQGLIQIESTDSAAIMSIISAGTADANRCGTISLGRHRGGIGDTPTIVQDNDALGAIVFAGGDGNDMRSTAAKIHAEVDGTPGQDDMPGALVFSTTPDGSSSPYQQERLRITSAGNMGLGCTPESTADFQIRNSSAGNLKIGGSGTDATGFSIDYSNSGTTTTTIKQHYGATNGAALIHVNTGTFTLATGTSNSERLRVTSAGKVHISGTRAGALQASDDDTLQLYTKSSDNSINRGSGITFYNHDGSGYEMGGTIQVAKENGTLDNTSSYMRFATRANGGDVTERVRIDANGHVNIKGGNLFVGLDSATLDFTDSNSYTKFIEIGADGDNGGDALLVTHSSGKGVGYFGYEAGGDRLVVACDNGGGNNKIDFIVNAGGTTGGSTDNLNGVDPALSITASGDLKRSKSLSQEVSTSVSSVSATSCGSFAKATYRSAYVVAQITQGTSYQVGRYLLIHDGTTVTTIEESAIATGSMLGTFEGVINGSNVEFRVTMGSASSATVITKIESIVV